MELGSEQAMLLQNAVSEVLTGVGRTGKKV